MAEPKLLLEFLIVAFDDPAVFGHPTNSESATFVGKLESQYLEGSASLLGHSMVATLPHAALLASNRDERDVEGCKPRPQFLVDSWPPDQVFRTPAQLKDSDQQFFRHPFERANNGSNPTRPFLPSRAISRERPRVHFSDHTEFAAVLRRTMALIPHIPFSHPELSAARDQESTFRIIRGSLLF
jgi:hypothetical protein